MASGQREEEGDGERDRNRKREKIEGRDWEEGGERERRVREAIIFL